MSGWTPDDMPDQSGRTALVTGANSGLGFWTSVELARKGARVLMACRNPEKASDALSRLDAIVPMAKAELVPLDLASLASVEKAMELAAASGVKDMAPAAEVFQNTPIKPTKP